jgi:protein phosphatase
VGVSSEVEPDVFTKKVKSGDVFLMCSDGLSNLVEMREMEKELKEKEAVLAAKNMVDLANKRGGDDNITLVVVQVLET